MAESEPKLIAADGLPARPTGAWVNDKKYYLEKYLAIFTKGIRRKWNGKIAYIDLFSGPGRSVIRETGEEIAGSPLIALAYGFASYVFVDRLDVIETLMQRLKDHPERDKISFIAGDCNQVIDEVRRRSPADHLALAFIDPTGLQIRFDTIRRLVQGRSIDLLMTIQFGMAVKRNLQQYLGSEGARLTAFLGRKGWREEVRECGTAAAVGKRILDMYTEQLRTLGYESDREIEVRSDQRNLLLYFLVLASRHPRAHDFWRKTTKIKASGQRNLYP